MRNVIDRLIAHLSHPHWAPIFVIYCWVKLGISLFAANLRMPLKLVFTWINTWMILDDDTKTRSI